MLQDNKRTKTRHIVDYCDIGFARVRKVCTGAIKLLKEQPRDKNFDNRNWVINNKYRSLCPGTT